MDKFTCMVALARVVLAERYGIRPDFVDATFTGGTPGTREWDAQLLIGDKVVCEEPRGYEHQVDLGGAWKEMTGLPFVFATHFHPHLTEPALALYREPARARVEAQREEARVHVTRSCQGM